MTDICPMCSRDREILVAAVCSRCGFDTRPSELEAARSEEAVSSTRETRETAQSTADAESVAEDAPVA